ncbi:MAG: MFS transporter [Mariprofundaceae bacterium]
MKRGNSRAIWSWATYDWANSVYATTILAGFFPVFFKQYWATGLSINESTFWLGMANAVAGLAVALMAPLLGAVADQGGLKKRFLLLFTFLGILMTAALFWAAQGAWMLAVSLFIFGAIGFSGGLVFYDALIVDVSEPEHYDRVSALGYALGYVGGGILFSINVLMTLHPDWFGLADSAEAVRWSFASVAVWWAVFTVPLMLFVHEQGEAEEVRLLQSMRAGWVQFRDTFRHIRSLRVVFVFLLAYFLYIDGVGTIIRMAVDYGLALGFDSSILMMALLLTQFVAFPAALVWGKVGESWGAKRSIMFCIGVYIAVCLWGYGMATTTDFYLLACVIGLVMGGVQALSRSFYARIIPSEQAAEFFGFYNMLGKFAAVMGPMLMGLVSMLSGNARLSILAIIILFAAGGALLYVVDDTEGGMTT